MDLLTNARLSFFWTAVDGGGGGLGFEGFVMFVRIAGIGVWA